MAQEPPDQLAPDQEPPVQVPVDQVPPDQLRPDQLRPDQLRPDQSLPLQLRPDQLRPDQASPDQLRPFQDPPVQAVPAACAAALKGAPKMSCSPVRGATPLEETWSEPRDASIDPVPVAFVNFWAYAGGVLMAIWVRLISPAP